MYLAFTMSLRDALHVGAALAPNDVRAGDTLEVQFLHSPVCSIICSANAMWLLYEAFQAVGAVLCLTANRQLSAGRTSRSYLIQSD